MALRLLFYNINRALCHTCSKHIATSNSDMKGLNESAKDWKIKLHNTMKVLPNFISEEEENILMQEVDPYMKRLRYEYSHWDNVSKMRLINKAIHGYRETEWRKWSKDSSQILDRVRKEAFPPEMTQLTFVHILDLASEGWIKPHIDSVRFCGGIIAGLSLLTDSVMKLTIEGHEKEFVECFLLPRRSLYIMSGVARYKYNHEILKSEESYFEGRHVPKSRRISIICRSEPDPEVSENSTI